MAKITIYVSEALKARMEAAARLDPRINWSALAQEAWEKHLFSKSWPKANNARHGVAWQGRARRGKARPGSARLGKG